MEKNLKISSNNKTIRGKLYYSISDSKNPLVICNSGYGGSGSQSGTWQIFKDELLKKSPNINLLLWDYSGQGTSDGGIESLTPFLAINELDLFINELRKYSFIDFNRICLYGSSFGGYISLIYAGLYKNIKLLALKSPVSDYAEVREKIIKQDGIDKWRESRSLIVDDNGGSSPYEFYVQSKSIDIYSRICSLITNKTFIVHGDSDTNVPVNQSIELNNRLEDSEIKIIKGANHGYKEGNSLEILTDSIVEFIISNI